MISEKEKTIFLNRSESENFKILGQRKVGDSGIQSEIHEDLKERFTGQSSPVTAHQFFRRHLEKVLALSSNPRHMLLTKTKNLCQGGETQPENTLTDSFKL